jgi:hypothetical protein
MGYQIEVLIEEPAACGHGKERHWRAVRPTGGAPYEYATHAQAANMARICYGSTDADYRIVRVRP